MNMTMKKCPHVAVQRFLMKTMVQEYVPVATNTAKSLKKIVYEYRND